MIVLSLFDGISCGQIALRRAWIPITEYYASEVDKNAIKVTQHNFPDTIQVWDVTKINKQNLPLEKVDLLMWGSPCQAFSNAWKMRGFEDERSQLFFEFVRLLKLYKPKHFLFENVRMKQEWLDIITEHLWVEPIRINSKLVSGGLRDRYYWTNIPNITQPEDRNINFQSILDSGYADRLKARAILASEAYPTKNMESAYKRYKKYGFWNLVFTSKDLLPKSARYLNQKELERLMTMPEWYTSILNRNQACKLIGNGWTVEVIKHLLAWIK